MNRIVRSAALPGSLLESEPGTAAASRLFGHFAVFNTWTTVRGAQFGSWWPDGVPWGQPYRERIASGSFTRSFSEDRLRIRCCFQHGADPVVGLKPLGEIVTLRDDGIGGLYEADLFDDAAYVRELLPGLRAGIYGASFIGEVLAHRVDRRPKASPGNPQALPEVTVNRVALLELGPVTWGQYPGATAKLREAA